MWLTGRVASVREPPTMTTRQSCAPCSRWRRRPAPRTHQTTTSSYTTGSTRTKCASSAPTPRKSGLCRTATSAVSNSDWIPSPHYAHGPMWGVQFGLGRYWQDSRFTLWHPYRYMNLQKKIWEVEICRSWCFAGSKVFLLNGLSQCFAGFMVLLLSRLTERIELRRHSAPICTIWVCCQDLLLVFYSSQF